MKRHFGGIITRLLRGGTTLTAVEHQLLTQLIAALPASLRTIVEAQFESYELAQREFDGRALNFYGPKGGPPQGFPFLEMPTTEAPLTRLTAVLNDEVEPVHATLTAVRGRVFCMALSRSVHSYPSTTRVEVSGVKAAWRSNFRCAPP